MGLFDKFKKKFEDAGTDKKVQNVVDEKKKGKKDDKKPKKQEQKKGGLTAEEIKRAQAMETGSPKTSEKNKDGDGKKKEKKQEARDTKQAYRVLIKPLFTEKASYLAADNKYIFEVHPNATKPEVRKAVQSVYNITPVGVQMMRVRGKGITFGRISGTTKGWKKAIVTLPKGKTIDVYQS